MNTETLKTICRMRDLSQSELARSVGVTRQAVSAWLKASAGAGAGAGEANIQTRHLRALSRVLGVSEQELLDPLPGLGHEQRERWRALFLWDSLYPDLDSFLLALARGEDRALARLVDRVGLYRAAGIAGAVVWRRFPAYRGQLHPMRRSALERLWQLRKSRASR